MQAAILNEENLQPGLSPEVISNIENLIEGAWKAGTLSRLRRGPANISDLGYESVVNLDWDKVNGIHVGVFALVGENQCATWIEDLKKQGFLTRDGEVLTGLGEYAEVPITEIEEEVLSSLESAYGRTMTVMGVKRKMKHSGLTTEQIEAGLEGLVRKGYVEDVDTTEAGSIRYTVL